MISYVTGVRGGALATLSRGERTEVAQTDRHDARRELVAEATWAVIRRAGLSGASLREIAREAGCTTGVLTHYFRNKDELLLFTFSYAMRNVAGRMNAHVRGDAGAVERLLAVMSEALPMDEERRLEVLVYFGFLEAAMRDDDLAAEFGRRYDEWSRLVSGLVAEHLGKRARREADAIGALLLAVVDGIAVGAVTNPDRFPPAQQSDLLRTAVRRLLP
jgi:TetR/AcrR family transcriptional regulator, transcriptional repressor of bet genes